MWGTGQSSGWSSWSNGYAYPGPDGNFESICTELLRDMVRQHRNHPSIGVWSLGNEYTYTESSQAANLKAFVIKLNTLVKTEDSLFATACGMGYGQVPASTLAPLVDVSGYNGDGLGVSNPGKPNLMSEFNTSGGRSRPGSAGFGANEGTKYAWRSGAILWCGINHGSCLGMGSMGVIDIDRIPQRSYYDYCNSWGGMTLPTFPATGTGTKIQLLADVYTNPAVTFQGNNAITVLNNGTQDVMLVARIVNASGAWVNSNVQITLTAPAGTGSFGAGNTYTRPSPWGLVGAEFHVSSKTGPVTITASSPGLETGSVTFNVKEDASVSIHKPNSNNSFQSEQNNLFIKQIISGKRMQIQYNITGYFSLAKEPSINIYSLDGSLIEQIKITRRCGTIQINEQKHIPAGVFVCRLVYGNRTALTKGVVVQ